jgi:gluconate kinase
MDKRIFILFGKTGAGKNYVARVFEKEFGYHWYDADMDLTLEMVHAIQHKLEFTFEMRAQYFAIVKQRMKALLPTAKKLIVTQGLFKNMNRHDLMKEFPMAKWVWVDAAQNVIEERILKRNNIITPEYARKINTYFEEPDFHCYKIINNHGKTEILKQAELIKEDLISSVSFE